MSLPERSRLGGYMIQRFVRAGSTGDLYIARRVGAPSLAPEVAIKVIAPELVPTPRAWRGLEDDVRRASFIDDPRVVHVEETGEDEGNRYIVMECVRGFSLADVLAFYAEKGKKMRPAHAVYIAMQTALALQAALESRDPKGQALRMVHGAISPKTILVSWRGHVKVVRFGLARTKATPSDAKSDVFAIGAALWQSLAGDVLSPRVDDRLAAVPPHLAEPVARALDDVADRRPSAGMLFRELAASAPDAAQVTPGDLARELAAIRLDREFASFARDRAMGPGASFVPPKLTEPPPSEGDIVVVVPKAEDASRLAAAAASLLSPSSHESAEIAKTKERDSDKQTVRPPSGDPDSDRMTGRPPGDYPPSQAPSRADADAASAPAPSSDRVVAAPSSRREAAASSRRETSDAPLERAADAPMRASGRVAIAIAAFATGILATTLLGVISRSRHADDGVDGGGLASPAQYINAPLVGGPITTSSIATASASAKPALVVVAPPASTARREEADAATRERDAAVAVAIDAAAPLAVRPDAAAPPARDGGDENVFDRATARALAGDLGGARRALESRVTSGDAGPDEIALLRAICRQQRDLECLRKLGGGEAPAPRP
ncbi:MAG TPA: protein kinase [Labilithrix sp.]